MDENYCHVVLNLRKIFFSCLPVFCSWSASSIQGVQLLVIRQWETASNNKQTAFIHFQSTLFKVWIASDTFMMFTDFLYFLRLIMKAVFKDTSTLIPWVMSYQIYSVQLASRTVWMWLWIKHFLQSPFYFRHFLFLIDVREATWEHWWKIVKQVLTMIFIRTLWSGRICWFKRYFFHMSLYPQYSSKWRYRIFLLLSVGIILTLSPRKHENGPKFLLLAVN